MANNETNFNFGSDSKNFFVFISRSFTDPDDTVRKVFLQFIKPVFSLMYKILCDALPEYSKQLVFWKLHFSIGALMHSMNVCENVRTEFDEMTGEIDAGSLVDMIIPYVTAGMKA